MVRSYSITFCVIIIFINCLWSIHLLLNAHWYWYIFQYLPPSQIMLRYSISWIGRILLITAGIGIWQLEDWGRKLAIILFVVNILTLPWKHPPMAVEYSFNYYYTLPKLNVLMVGIPFIKKINLISLSVMAICAWDFLLNATLIFFFTRGKIRKQFH